MVFRGQPDSRCPRLMGWNMPFVYVLRCSDNSLYTGYTVDLARRLEEHQEGKASKYTRGRRPVKLVYAEQHPDKNSALRRECAIKRMKKAAKEGLLSRNG